MSDEQNAILTSRQREFLQGEGYDTGDAERMARKRIRDRVRAAIDDLQLLVQATADGTFDISSALDDDPPMWALSAFLFAWTTKNKAVAQDLRDFLDPTEEETAQTEMDRRTEMMNIQMERGVQTYLEFSYPDHAVRKVENSLTVDLGPELSELSPDDLAELPRRRLDALLRSGDLDDETYAAAVRERYDRN
jgi:hypothetical protein